MAYTSHGHHIPGSVKDDPEPGRKARCGATTMCRICKDEAQAFHNVDPMDFQTKAKHIVLSWIEENPLALDGFEDFEIKVHWFSKTLQNWKSCLMTDRPDDLYFEVTYDGDYKRAYLDVYRKLEDDVFDRESEDLQAEAKNLVRKWIGSNPAVFDHGDFDVYVSWFAEATPIRSFMLGTTRPDGLYFEVIYDGSNDQSYFAVHRKIQNILVPD